MELIISTAIAVFLWIVNPRDIRNRVIKRILAPVTVDYSRLEVLSRQGLKVKDAEHLQSPHLRARYRDLFWPVVPSRTPNLIHASFISELKQLSMMGIRTTLFVFDEYAARIRNEDDNTAREYAQGFVQGLMTMGLQSCNVKVVYQSDVSSASVRAAKLLPTMLRCLGKLTCKDLNLISRAKTYMCDDTPSIRYFKPILNMLYLMSVKGRYGYVLAGSDEEILWDSFTSAVAGDSKSINPVKLLIPTMPGLSGNPTHTLDRDDNIYLLESEENVSRKINVVVANIAKENALTYIWDRVFFSRGHSIDVNTQGGTVVLRVNSIADLRSRVNRNEIAAEDLRQAFIDSVKVVFSGGLHVAVSA